MDTVGIGADELMAVRSFLARRDGLTRDARAQLAKELADRLRPKVGGAVGTKLPNSSSSGSRRQGRTHLDSFRPSGR